MKEIIEQYREIVVQIATPYSTGTGFCIAVPDQPTLIVTNDHVVRDNRYVVVESRFFGRQLATVLYSDPKFDLAFLSAPVELALAPSSFGASGEVAEGDIVIAVGHPFGLKYTATKGIISNTMHQINNLQYLQHDAALNPGNSGGPLLNLNGEIIGINTFIIQNGNSIGFSLPADYLKSTLASFFAESEQQIGARCSSCTNLVFEKKMEDGAYCPHCGAKIKLPSQAAEYEPTGISKTIENILTKIGYDVRLSRLGPNQWFIRQGSATISLSVHPQTGLITGDAALGVLPKENIKPIYEYLLRQNNVLEVLTFSIRGQDVVLSLVVNDRFLNTESGEKLFQNLFQQADYYDDVLSTQFGILTPPTEESDIFGFETLARFQSKRYISA